MQLLTNKILNNLKTTLDIECLEIKTFAEITLKNSIENKINVQKYNLSKLEAQLIQSYTAMNSNWINSDLRRHGFNNCSCKSDVQNLINSGLNNIPRFINNIVYRMEPENLYETIDIKKWYKSRIGKLIKAPFFLSTSKDKWEDRSIVLKIETSSNSNGRDLSKININTSEKEVLFNSGTLFKIINVNEQHIELQEINLDNQEPIIWISKNII
jgi:hypothetical protein